MSHTIATWRLSRWLPPDRQSAKGIRRLQDPDRMPQPPVNDTAEAWSRFMHCQLFQFRNAPGLILDQLQVSLPHVRGMLLMKQQIPAGLPQKQKQLLQLHLVEVFCTPGLYRRTRQDLNLSISIHRDQHAMPNTSPNLSVEEVVRHLSSLGVSDYEVREAYHYSIGWIKGAAESRHEEDSAPASDVLQRLNQLPGPEEVDAPLMTEPQWWIAPPGSQCLTQPPPPKRKWEFEVLDAAPPLSGNPGLSASMHAVSHISVPPGSNPGPVASSPAVPPGIHSLSIHPELPMARLNITPPSSVSSLPNDMSEPPPASGHLGPEADNTSPAMVTPDYADGGWTYVGPVRRTKAEKNKAKKERRRQCDAAAGISPANPGGIKFATARFTCSRHKNRESNTEETDSVSLDDESDNGTVPLRGEQSLVPSYDDTTPETPVSQIVSTSHPITPTDPSIPLGSGMDLDIIADPKLSPLTPPSVG
jgi:hypothetical protein